MENAILFTALLLGAAVLGGFIGSCCSKGRQAGDHEGRIAELEDRLDALADHAMDEAKNVKARVGALEDSMDAFQTHCLEQEQAVHAELDEHEFLIGDTPTGGLLGRVSALEDHRKVNDEEHRVLREVLLAVSRHGKVEGLEEALGFKEDAQDER